MTRALFLASLLIPSIALAGDVTPIAVDLAPFVGHSTFALGQDTRAVSVGLGGTLQGDVRGINGSSGVNVVVHDVYGAQGAGGVNVGGGRVKGVQGAGGVNIAGGEVKGMQAAGGANIAGPVRGFQASGGFNLAAGSVYGFQASGGVNIAAGDVRGFQVGVVNVARDVRGFQVGVVNISRSSPLSLGLVNVVTHGRTHVDVWGDEAGFAHVGITHGSTAFHNSYALGWRPQGDCRVYSFTWGWGFHVPLPGRYSMDGDYLLSQLAEGNPFDGVHLLHTVRTTLVIDVGPGAALMLGPTWNYAWSADPASRPVPFRTKGGQELRGWPGFQVGVQLM